MKILITLAACLYLMPIWAQKSSPTSHNLELRTDLWGPITPKNHQYELGLERLGWKPNQGIIATIGYSVTDSLNRIPINHIFFSDWRQKHYVGLEYRQYFSANKENNGAFIGASFQHYWIQDHQLYWDEQSTLKSVLLDTISNYQQNAFQVRLGYKFSDRPRKWSIEPSASFNFYREVFGESYLRFGFFQRVQLNRFRVSIIRRF